MKSRLFSPYRIYGQVSDAESGFQVFRRGTEIFVIVSIGEAWQIYEAKHLRLRLVSGRRQNEINSLFVTSVEDGSIVFSSSKSVITAWKRHESICELRSHSSDILQMEQLGKYLISLGKDHKLMMWDLKSINEGLSSITCSKEISIGSDEDPATCFLHPDAYLNKVVVAHQSGIVKLWNIRSGKLIHEFTSFPKSRVMCLAQSSVVDVVAIGFADGSILIHNLYEDKTITVFKMDNGPVTSLSFRKDEKHPILVSSNRKGQIATWDLKEKQLSHLLNEAHNGNITKVQFIETEPVFLSCGHDNALKMWIYDQPDGAPRLLKQRSGHAEPPTKVKFCEHGIRMLSCSSDRSLRMFHLYKDEQNVEFSQGKLLSKTKSISAANELKMEEITDFDYSPLKARFWDSIVSAHENQDFALLWNFERKAIGNHRLQLPEGNGVISSVCVSSCANFAVLGTSSGHIFKFNMQSGMIRTAYESKISSGIIYVCVDALNKELVSVAESGDIQFWDFYTGKLLDTVSADGMTTNAILHKDSGLLAVGCSDFSIKLFDIRRHTVVRLFRGNTSLISSLCFTNDGRWFISSASDGSIRVWDIPSAALIDCFRFSQAVTSIDISPDGSFFATTHAENLGIYIWVNRSQFTNVYLNSVPNDPLEMDQPDFIMMDEEESLPEVLGESIAVDPSRFVSVGFVPMESNMISSSDMSQTKWKAILHQEEIKRRNKPKKEVKKDLEAPFFLPTTKEVDPKLIIEPMDDSSEHEKHLLDPSQLEGSLQDLLHNSEKHEAVFHFLKSLSPSAIDMQIRAIGFFEVEETETIQTLALMLDFLEARLNLPGDFEFIESLLHLFLKVHSSEICSSPILVDKVSNIRRIHESKWAKVEDFLNFNISLLKFISQQQ